MPISIHTIEKILGKQAGYLLEHTAAVPQELLHLPGKFFVERIFSQSDRSKYVVKHLQKLYGHGRLANTGYLSILPVDQGIEHSAGASFAKNPMYFDPEHIVRLALEGGCSGVASSVGTLAMVSNKYADKIPFIVKLNHNDLLRFPNTYDQTMFASVDQAWNLGAIGVGATIYFGSEESKRQIEEVSRAFYEAHQRGMFTILWCYLRNDAYKTKNADYHESADLTSQANYLGATIGADIIKQKLPVLTGGYKALNTKKIAYGKYDERMYSELSSNHPIDLCRYQVLHGFAGRIGLINSGGASGKNDMRDAVYAAVVNKRAGGHGLILGRKAFQKPMHDGVDLLHAVQDVYLCKEVAIA